jgi:DNA-binding MarR family transcriptional regulator
MARHYGEAWNTRYGKRDRQLMLWVSHSSKGSFFMLPANQKEELINASMKDIYDGKAWILTLGLFKPTDKKGVFERDYLDGETRLQYFHRALSKVDTEFALVWQLDRLLADRGCAEHSNRQFAEELKRDMSWISRYLKKLVREGIVNRYGGNLGRGQKMYYCNPGDENLNRELLERYGEHKEDDPRHAKFDDPTFQAQREQYIEDREKRFSKAEEAPAITVTKIPKTTFIAGKTKVKTGVKTRSQDSEK